MISPIANMIITLAQPDQYLPLYLQLLLFLPNQYTQHYNQYQQNYQFKVYISPLFIVL